MNEGAMQAVAEHVGVVAAVLDDDGHVVYANHQFEESFGAVETGTPIATVLERAVVSDSGEARLLAAIQSVIDGAVAEADAEVSVHDAEADASDEGPNDAEADASDEGPNDAEAGASDADPGDVPCLFHFQMSKLSEECGRALVEAHNVTDELARIPGIGSILDRIDESFYAVDDEWRVTYWNDVIAARTSIPATDIVGEVAWDVFGDLEGTELKARYEQAMTTGESAEFRTYLPEPFDHWVEARVHPDENGMSVFSKDVTDEVERERQLERYETIVEHANDAVIIKDRDGRYQLVNARAAEFVGRPVSDVVGKTEHDLFDADVADAIRANERRVIEREERIQEEETIVTPTGEFVSQTTRIPYYEDGELAGTIGIRRDVTEEVAYDRELEARSEKLELLNRILRHDIRNDMTVVLVVLDLLGEHVTDDDGADLLAEVRERADHVVDLTAVLRDLMTVVLEDGDALHHVSLQYVVEHELEDVDVAFPRVTTRIDGDLPTVRVRANEMLPSVFRNLFKNAVQHNDADRPELEVGARVDGDTVTVRVADNGPGIPEERRTSVFGRGEKGLESGGTGIGLYLVDRLVDEYGGHVAIEDNDPDGTVFVVELERWTDD